MGSLALKDVYGDEFLLKKSSLYKQTRILVLRAGYRFSYKEEDYFNWPLMHLPWILSKKKIPYRRNLRALKSVARRHSMPIKKFLDLPFSLEGNYLLHESAHCLAHEILRRNKKPPVKNLAENVLFEGYFGEACANASDALLSLQANKNGNLPFQARINSYIQPNKTELLYLDFMRAEIGERQLHELLIHFYFFVNIRVKKLTRVHLKAIAQCIGFRLLPRIAKLAQKIFMFAARLSATFVEHTNKYHFFLSGLTQNFKTARTRLQRNALSLTPMLQQHAHQFTIQLVPSQ